MDSLVTTFHLDLKLMIAQIINFAIVFFVLYRYGFKPLFKMVDERNEKIEKGLDDAKKFEEKLEAAENDYNKKIDEAKKEAHRLIEEAVVRGEEKRRKILEKTKEEIGEIINQEKEKMQLDKEKTLKEIRSEVADLVFMSLEKILETRIGDKTEKELIKKSIKQSLK